MGSYKWFLAAHALFGSAWEICLVLVHIEPAFPAPVVMLGGVLQNFVPRDGFQYAVVNYALVCLGGAICSVIAMFVQRFCQTAGEKVFFGWLRPGQFRVIAFSSSVLGFSLIGLAVNQLLASPTELKEILEYENAPLAQIVRHRTLITLNATGGWARFCFGVIAAYILFFFPLVAYCTYGCYSSLRDVRLSLSTSTLRLYRRLVNSLLIDLAFSTIGLMPIMALVAAVYAQAEWGSIAMIIAISVTGLYPLESHMLWLIYLPPYRRAVMGLFGRRFQLPGAFKVVSPMNMSLNV